MFIRKNSNGNWYVHKAKNSRLSGRHKGLGQDWFLLSMDNYGKVIIPTKYIFFPKEFHGKKVRLKVEIIGDLNSIR